MILGLANSLFRMFRENSDVVTVSRLKKQGVRQVTVLDWDRIEGLISRAVEEAISRRGVSLSKDALATVNQEALEAFHRLVQERDQYQESARSLEEEKAELSRNLSRLREEFERSNNDLERERGRVVAVDEVSLDGAALSGFSERLEEELRAMLSGAEGGDAVPGSVAALARRLVEEERERAVVAARAEQRMRVATLERRVSKLKRTLADSEAAASRMRAATDAPAGVESIYREVQGLDQKDAHAGEKKGLLDQIFRLNVELRDVIGGEATGGTDGPGSKVDAG